VSTCIDLTAETRVAVATLIEAEASVAVGVWFAVAAEACVAVGVWFAVAAESSVAVATRLVVEAAAAADAWLGPEASADCRSEAGGAVSSLIIAEPSHLGGACHFKSGRPGSERPKFEPLL
jgi:hypothetical protein